MFVKYGFQQIFVSHNFCKKYLVVNRNYKKYFSYTCYYKLTDQTFVDHFVVAAIKDTVHACI